MNRRQIVRACKQRGWTIQPVALKGIEGYLKSNDGQSASEALEELLSALADQVTAHCVTEKVWESMVKQVEDNSNVGFSVDRKSGENRAWTDLKIVNAFQTPKLVYDVKRKSFAVEDRTCSLFGTAEDKINMLAQRYALTHQRVLRHRLFQPIGLHATEEAIQHKLTPVESLLGQDNRQSLLLLGVLLQIEEGKWYMEDPTGQVPVSFQESTASDDFFVTEHNILLVEGVFQDGILYIQKLGHPLLEPREISLQAVRQQVFHPRFRKPKAPRGSRNLEDKSSFVVVSDVHLDQPKVIQNLEVMWARYESIADANTEDLPAFVLIGNFSSTPLSCPTQLSALWDELASALQRFPLVAQHAHLVLVPGPHDGIGDVLPFPAVSSVSKHLEQQASHLHLATNPCRITWQDQEMVVFRYDLLHTLQQHQLLPAGKLSEDEDRRDPRSKLFSTILDQGHLIPVAGTPVYWQADHALSLYPLPTAIVLADRGGCDPEELKEGLDLMYGGVRIIQPGSLVNGSYSVYRSGVTDGDDQDTDKMIPMESQDPRPPPHQAVELVLVGMQS